MITPRRSQGVATLINSINYYAILVIFFHLSQQLFQTFRKYKAYAYTVLQKK